MSESTGCITVAQENRFRLVDDHGVSHLFIVAHDFPLSPYALSRLAARQARVRVAYENDPTMIARVARTMTVDERERNAP